MRETNSLANVHLNRTKCLQVLKTPPPGSGPSKTKEVLPAVSSESLRSAMAATGGRNQRRLANLKTETTNTPETDLELQIISSSILEQRKIASNVKWTTERERLAAIVDLSKQMPDVTESERSANMRELYNFLKRPVEEVEQVSLETASKSLKTSRNTNVDSFSTPASALAASSSSSSKQVEQDARDDDYTTVPPLRYQPDQTESDDHFEYEEDYGMPYEAI